MSILPTPLPEGGWENNTYLFGILVENHFSYGKIGPIYGFIQNKWENRHYTNKHFTLYLLHYTCQYS